MGVLGTVGKFAGGLNWIRVGLIAVIAVLIFGAGYQFSNTKHAKKDAATARATSLKIAELSREHAEEMRAMALVAADKDRQFTRDIAEIETHREALIEQIRTVALTKPIPEIRVEACLEGDEDVQIVVANPFNDSFRLFWNQASRDLRSPGSTGANP